MQRAGVARDAMPVVGRRGQIACQARRFAALRWNVDQSPAKLRTSFAFQRKGFAVLRYCQAVQVEEDYRSPQTTAQRNE
ncbi:hypothetical protein BKA25_002730 [Actinoalloteichus hymeniacidonis]|nr:hypothetical protein [Actinoalloteichus hymeniacidonis]